jgi:hypothetical protein
MIREDTQVRYLLTLCLVFAGAIAFAQPDPVTNGGFEELDAKGFPADWSAVGTGVKVTTEAHSGKYAMRIERGKQPEAGPETGLNRAWTPDSGEQGRMLAETKGGIIFWYKIIAAAPSADISIQVIPMSARAWEDTGEPRVLRRLPNDLAGDGQWHEGRLAYDFSGKSAVKWVHVGARITGSPATLLLDDIRYVERVGPLLNVEKVHVYPDAKQPGRAALLTASVTNIGDAPTGAVQLLLELPEGITAAPAGPLPPLAVGGAEVVRWNLSGTMRAGPLRVEASDGESKSDYSMRLAPDVEIVSLLAKPGMSAPDGEVEVTATFRNKGAALADSVSATLSVPAGPSTRSSAPIAPGAQATIQWRVRLPRKSGEYALSCIAGLDMRVAPEDSALKRGMIPIKPVSATAIVTDALTKPAGKVAGLLWIRRGSDRTIGELRMPGSKDALCARLPHLGKVVTRLPDGTTQTLYARYTVSRKDGQYRTLGAQARDRAGGVWMFAAVAEPRSSVATDLFIFVHCNKPRTMLAFEGPTLLVGEGSTGTAKSEAIFPGLEWLAPDEVSSSDLDIAADHADRMRFVPHPHKVTIPVMGVKTPMGTVGLLWNVHHLWDGQNWMPQPVFAVPDRLTGAAAHRLGLIAPNVLNGLPENALWSSKGYALSAGKPLILQATLYADPSARDALAAMDEWFRLYKPDPIMPAPQGSDKAQIAWSMRAYMNTLWVSVAEGWLPFLGGPGIWRKPGFDSSFAYDLAQGARILPDNPDAPRWRERVAEVLPRIGTPQAEDLGFAGHNTPVHFGNVAAQAYQLMAAQGPDGAWRFDANRRDEGVFKGLDYHEIGPDKAAELGTIARSAYEVLRYARMSGDEEAYRAGVKSLEFMRRFTIPRAAQVWEVPLHTPDILAAADAVDAYLEAYRFTQRNDGGGDPLWLREAQRWARAGLPFVYVWNAPGKPWMRYGSIPVFGASWYQYSWFGNIVQWNGLRHAFALLKLYEYDPKTRCGGLSWRDIALGITRCAMYQQSTEEKNLCLWPDSYGTITGVRAQWDFAPRQILKNIYPLMGRVEEPRTLTVSSADGAARVTASALIESAEWSGNTLRARLRRNPGETGSVLFAGVTRPDGVRVNGQPVRERSLDAGTDGWQYDAARRLLVVPADGERAEVEARGVRAAKAVGYGLIVDRIAFEFSEDTEGWVAAHDLAPLRVENGALVLEATGGDPYLHRFLCRIPGDSVKAILLRMRGSGDGGGQIYWTTQASPGWDESKTMRFVFPTDGQWHEIDVPVGDHPSWRGQTITALRLDPGSTGGSKIEIDWIRAR